MPSCGPIAVPCVPRIGVRLSCSPTCSSIARGAPLPGRTLRSCQPDQQTEQGTFGCPVCVCPVDAVQLHTHGGRSGRLACEYDSYYIALVRIVLICQEVV